VAQHATAPAGAVYAERLRVPWWLWIPALGLGAILAAEVYLGAPGLTTWVPYAIVLPLTVAGLWWLGRLRVAVEDGELRVDDARLPARFVAGVTVLGPAEKRVVLGTGARPHAFVVQGRGSPAPSRSTSTIPPTPRRTGSSVPAIRRRWRRSC